MEKKVAKEQTKSKVRVGIMGCATASQVAHLRAAAAAENVELTAICDGSKDIRWKMAAVYEPRRLYSTYQEMLDDPGIDAVVIGVPDRFHADSAMQAVLAGKHVLVEQPMGLSVEECETLLELGHRKNQVVQVSSLRRFDPGISYAKKFLDRDLGQAISYQGWLCESNSHQKDLQNFQASPVDMINTRRALYAKSGQQFLYQQAVHALDMAVFLLGRIREISAQFTSLEDMQSWDCMLRFECGVNGTLSLNHNIRGKQQEGFRLFGTNGSITANCHSLWQLCPTELSCQNIRTGEIVSPYDSDGQVYRRQMENFANVILADKKMAQVGAGMKDGIHVLQAVLAIIESAAQGGRPIVVSETKNRTSI